MTLICREFVVNMMSDWFVEAANHSCGEFPPEVRGWVAPAIAAHAPWEAISGGNATVQVDELALTGLHPLPSVKVSAARL